MSISTPVANHPLQLVLWNQVMVDAAAQGAPEFVNRPEYAKLLEVEPHHHVPALAFGVQTFLDHTYGNGKYKLEMMQIVPGFDRATFIITNGGYIAVEEAKAPPAWSFEISYYVYTEAITTHKAPKSTATITDEDDTKAKKNAPNEVEVEDDKSQKTVTKTDANIPVVFISKDKRATRHYQESRPMHVHAGMTNLLVASMVKEIAGFLLTGTLPPNIK